MHTSDTCWPLQCVATAPSHVTARLRWLGASVSIEMTRGPCIVTREVPNHTPTLFPWHNRQTIMPFAVGSPQRRRFQSNFSWGECPFGEVVPCNVPLVMTGRLPAAQLMVSSTDASCISVVLKRAHWDATQLSTTHRRVLYGQRSSGAAEQRSSGAGQRQHERPMQSDELWPQWGGQSRPGWVLRTTLAPRWLQQMAHAVWLTIDCGCGNFCFLQIGQVLENFAVWIGLNDVNALGTWQLVLFV